MLIFQCTYPIMGSWMHSTRKCYGDHIQFFKDLKITMGNYVFHSNIHTRDMDNMDMLLVYP